MTVPKELSYQTQWLDENQIHLSFLATQFKLKQYRAAISKAEATFAITSSFISQILTLFQILTWFIQAKS